MIDEQTVADLREAARFIAERSYCIGKPGGIRSEQLADRLDRLADALTPAEVLT